MASATDHLTVLDVAAPGLVVGAHIVGSVALNDFVSGVSDLDLVCELAAPPDPRVLADAQSQDLDVIYVLRGELEKPVHEARSFAWGREGVLHTERRGDLVPVLWEQLRAYAITVRGEPPNPPVTPAEVVTYCRENLVEYWKPLLQQVQARRSGIGDGAIGRDAILWVAPGPARLWHTINTGAIVGKSQALHLAGAHWPDLAAPLGEVAAARRDPAVLLTREHAEAALELGRRVLDSA
ncbi:hypothetical protein GCM10010464_62270 [Pseudonocardia yunnanensis]